MLELDWPYKRHAGIFAGIQQYAQEQGWESIIDEYADATLLAPPAQAHPPYDGIIARATRKLARRAARLKVPVVNVWFSSPSRKSLPGVFPDFAAIGRLRAEHLLARGFRRFAALTSDTDRGQELDLKAFLAVLGKTGCPCAAVKMPLNATASLKDWRRTERTVAAWMQDWQPPIGVYVGPEPHGRIVAQMCRNRGWRVPEDVAIIAGWNEETLCEHLRPTLTSVEVGYERIGYEAARLLHRLMTRRKPPKQKHLLLPPQGLVVRESTDFFAVDHPLVRAALEFIAANSHRPIKAGHVARGVATGFRTLERRFRDYLGRPIAAEIRRVRIERAKRELAQTDKRLADIARDVGFGPEQRLYQVFCRELGVTPKQYRRQRQGAAATQETTVAEPYGS
jgi:LacI family transcriptional regulator